MQPKVLSSRGWSVATGLLLGLAVAAPAVAAPPKTPVELAIGAPLANSVVGGRISLSVAHDFGAVPVSAFTVYVDDQVQYSRSYAGDSRGIQYLVLDTNTIPDGNHVIRVTAVGPRGPIASDTVRITVKNGLVGGPDVVPPLVQFRGLRDGQEVSGDLDIEVLAEDNLTARPTVSLFVNRQVRLIKNVAPYFVRLNTAQFLDPNTGTGELQLEAWAFDDARNKGTARPITLKVVPAADGRQTPRRSDPTISPAPAAEGTVKGPDRVASRQGGSLVIPLPSKAARNMDPTTPAPIAATTSGSPGGAPVERLPGTRPDASPAAPRPGSIESPEFEPGVAAPELGRPREVTPAAPDRTAKSSPAAAPQQRGPVARGPYGTAVVKAQVRAPRAAEPITVPLPRSSTAVVPVPGIPEAPPSPRLARAPISRPGEKVIILRDPQKSPGPDGRIPLRVVRVQDPLLPRERDYTVHRGDTLYSVARKFGVTPRCVEVANGLTGRLRPGMKLRIPGTFDVVLNDRRVAFDVPPRVEGGLALAPFRQIFEHTGGVVVWYPDTQEVRAASEIKEIKLRIGSKEAVVDDAVVVMDREAFIDTGRTIVPVNFLKTALDLTAEYDVKTGTIILVKK